MEASFVLRRQTDGSAHVAFHETNVAPGRPLRPRLDLRNHSPTGFEWGYGGSGPAQLALAILYKTLEGKPRAVERALMHYQQFKWDVIAGLAREGSHVIRVWQVEEWLRNRSA